MQIINLNEAVIQALDLFIKNKPPRLDLKKFKLPFVVGSEGAFYTGNNLFANQPAIFANESDFQERIKAYAPLIKAGFIKDAVVISASGEKDSIWEVELAKKNKLKTTLLTCEAKSSAAQIANQVLVYRKTAEPYSYNFSTYVGMILSATSEDPAEIKKVIKRIRLPKNFSEYQAYTFLLPDKYLGICPLLETKNQEIFGSKLIIRAYTHGRARHAKFIVESDKELVISIGEKNKFFGKPLERWQLNLPTSADTALVQSLTYYLVGKIQEIKPPYFKNNITSYCLERGPIAYGRTKPFDIIVPGN